MRLLRWPLAACLLLLPAPLIADGLVDLDKGRLDVYVGDRKLGTEDFLIQSGGDTLKIFSAVFDMIPGPQGADSLAKRMTMILGARFKLDSDFIASAILVTTAGAVLTIPLFQLLIG